LKIALLTDLHFGMNDDPHFVENHTKFLMEEFWPKIDAEGVNILIFLGDLVHRRKYIRYTTADALKKAFFDQIAKRHHERQFRCDWIIGNHDLAYRELVSVSPAFLLEHECHVHTQATTLNYAEKLGERKDGSSIWETSPRICLVPWICKENKELIYKHLEKTDAKIIFGHLEIKGFEMNKGALNTELGEDQEFYAKFDKVYSGHFHHPSKHENIHYLGAATHQTWHDWKDERGFHIWDTGTNTLTFYENPFVMFEKIWYDDSKEGGMGQYAADVNNLDFSHLKDKVVKVIISAKINPTLFDVFMTKIEEAEPAEISTVDDHLNMQLNDDAEIVEEGKSTIDIIRDFVKQANDVVNVEKLDNLVVELYNKSLEGVEDE
jgi:hypothetical protein